VIFCGQIWLLLAIDDLSQIYGCGINVYVTNPTCVRYKYDKLSCL